MNNNDSRVIELKKQIAAKKESMGKPYNPSFLTCCVLELDGVSYNFNVASKDQLMHLAVKLELYKAQFNKMFPNDEYIIYTFTVDNWLDDISNVLCKRKYKEDMQKLKAMEQKLDKLLSNEKKVELEIDEIANLLK